ncbi:MAG: FAD-dependent oxidoreductase [Chitinophagaceae bacterium]|nr:FAD-dependent oxidoreductase [Chitinophagaceae bacterium]
MFDRYSRRRRCRFARCLCAANANIRSTVFEAGSRTGGRMYTATGMMGKGITTELGGEFVDSNHTDILNLAKAFGLGLVDTEKDNKLIRQIFHFNGKKYRPKTW